MTIVSSDACADVFDAVVTPAHYFMFVLCQEVKETSFNLRTFPYIV